MSPSLANLRQHLAARLPRDTPGRLVGLIMAILAVALLAYWITRISAPRPVAVLPETRTEAPQLSFDSVYRLFGVDASAGKVSSNLTLTGVFANANGRGFATFRLPQGHASALEGEEVMPGLTLARVAKDHVVLRGAAGEQRLQLTKDKAALPAAREER